MIHLVSGQLDLAEVATWTRRELEEAMAAGETPDADVIAPWVWKGYTLQFLTHVFGIRKFKKVFAPAGDYLQGYNLRVASTGGPLEGWALRRDARGRAQRHGFYDVVSPSPPDDHYPHALLINYDCGRNGRFDPSGLLRDYVVSLSPDLLLGKAYAAVGQRRVPLAFFVLERAEPLEARG